jgi:hypothetical protein
MKRLSYRFLQSEICGTPNFDSTVIALSRQIISKGPYLRCKVLESRIERYPFDMTLV